MQLHRGSKVVACLPHETTDSLRRRLTTTTSAAIDKQPHRPAPHERVVIAEPFNEKGLIKHRQSWIGLLAPANRRQCPDRP